MSIWWISQGTREENQGIEGTFGVLVISHLKGKMPSDFLGTERNSLGACKFN